MSLDIEERKSIVTLEIGKAEKHELKLIESIIEENEEVIKDRWNNYFK